MNGFTVLVLIAAMACCNVLWADARGAGELEYEGFGFPWEHNTLGLDRNVPPPWTPVRVADEGRVAEIWGRRYTFADGPLPLQIVSQDIDLLAAPIRLTLQADGRPVNRVEFASGFALSPTGDEARRAAVLVGEGVRAELSMRLEFDGFQIIELNVEPRDGARPRIERLTLDIPMRKEVARFFSHYLYYDFDTERIDRGRLADSAGAVGDGIKRAFSNHFWVGDHRVGIDLNFEDNRYWSNADPESAIEVIPVGEATTLRVTFVDKPIELAEGRLLYRVVLLVNPIKPMVRNWRTTIVDNVIRPPEGYNTDLWTFTTLRVGPNFFLPLEYVCRSTPPADPARRAEYDRVRAALKQNGVRYIPYSSLHSIDIRLPEVEKYGPVWIRDPSPEREKPEGGKRETVSLYNKSLRDFWVWHFVNLIRTENEEALFFDWATTGKPVVNPRAGNPELIAEGKSYKPIYSVYHFHRRLHKAVRAERPDYLITQHHSKMPIFFSVYSDSVYTGEAMNAFFRQEGLRQRRAGTLPEDMPPYVPDYSLFPDDHWLACYHQGFGFNNMFMSNIMKRWNAQWVRENPDEYKRYTRILFSRLIVLDVPALRIRLHTPTFDRLMLGFQEHFGGLVDPIQFVHPLDSASFRDGVDASRLKTGLYIRPDGRMALAVANWNAEPVTETLRLNFDGAGFPGKAIRQIVDIEGGAAPEHTANTIRVELPANDFRVYVIGN